MGCRRRRASATAPYPSSTAPVCAFTTAAPSPRAPSCATCASSAGRTSPSSALRLTAARPTARERASGRGPCGRSPALDSGYNFEMGVDLWESLDMVDVGDVSVIPANIEKTFDQIDKAVGYIHERAVFPVVLGGDHSIGYPDIRGIASRCRRQRRHHPLRPPFRSVRVQLRRADARHAVLPCHEHPQRPGHQPGPDRHRRLDEQPRRNGRWPASGARPSSP